MPNERGGPNEQVGWTIFFVYYMKNNGGGWTNFQFITRKTAGRVDKFSKINKRVYPFIRHQKVNRHKLSPLLAKKFQK